VDDRAGVVEAHGGFAVRFDGHGFVSSAAASPRSLVSRSKASRASPRTTIFGFGIRAWMSPIPS
jgi:hypothetical protein